MIIKDFNKAVKWRREDANDEVLYLWGNSEIDSEQLFEIVRSGNWPELQDVDGFFAGVYITSGKIHLFCDRLGVWPLFYSLEGSKVYSSPKAGEILDAIEPDLVPCKDGLLSLLLFGHHLSEETVFENIKRCNGGETIVIDSNGETGRVVWRKKHIYQDKSSVAPEELAELFVEGVSHVLPKNGDIILPVSGGFDSRCVLGAVMECVESERICLTTFGGEDTIDFQVGQLLANTIGVRSHVFPIADDYYDTDVLRERALNSGYTYPAFAAKPKEMNKYISQKAINGNISVWGAGGDAITGSHLRSDDDMLSSCNGFEDIASLLFKTRCYVPLSKVSELLHLEPQEAIQIVARLLKESVVEKHDKPWQFLDAWDIFVRGRMELINVVPLDDKLWCCPHFGREYFNVMSTQCFEEKLNQNIYRRMLASRFKFLFSLPTKRLGGRPLVSSLSRNIYYNISCQAGRANRFVKNMLGLKTDSAGRNYGKDVKFFNSLKGQNELQYALNVLQQTRMFQSNISDKFESIAGNVALASNLITSSYAFNR